MSIFYKKPYKNSVILDQNLMQSSLYDANNFSNCLEQSRFCEKSGFLSFISEENNPNLQPKTASFDIGSEKRSIFLIVFYAF